MASLGSFIWNIRKNLRPDTDPKTLGREWASLQELSLQRAMLFRDRLPDQSQFCDVHYDDLMANPLDTIEGIYRHFRMNFDPASRSAVADWLTANPQDKHGRHSYDCERFGLDAKALRERFAPYIERYSVRFSD